MYSGAQSTLCSVHTAVFYVHWCHKTLHQCVDSTRFDVDKKSQPHENRLTTEQAVVYVQRTWIPSSLPAAGINSTSISICLCCATLSRWKSSIAAKTFTMGQGRLQAGLLVDIQIGWLQYSQRSVDIYLRIQNKSREL